MATDIPTKQPVYLPKQLQSVTIGVYEDSRPLLEKLGCVFHETQASPTHYKVMLPDSWKVEPTSVLWSTIYDREGEILIRFTPAGLPDRHFPYLIHYPQ